jgi:hypothetical protein
MKRTTEGTEKRPEREHPVRDGFTIRPTWIVDFVCLNPFGLLRVLRVSVVGFLSCGFYAR